MKLAGLASKCAIILTEHPVPFVGGPRIRYAVCIDPGRGIPIELAYGFDRAKALQDAANKLRAVADLLEGVAP